MRFAILPFVILFALTACTPAAPPLISQSQTVDGLTITLEKAENPRINLSQSFVVTLTDAQGQPVDGADVYLDLTMPAMPMGTNSPIAEAQGDGRYTAGTAYTMTGAWEITVVAEVDGKEHRAVFTAEVVE